MAATAGADGDSLLGDRSHWNLGYRLPFALGLVASLGWALFIVGNDLVRETGVG